jgi:heme-degrading monooxygenase HmoA
VTTVLIMKFRVAPGRESEWETFVSERSRTAATRAGFERMYLLKPRSGGDEYRVVSWWKTIDKPDAFIRTETYEFSESKAHQGIVVGPVGHEILDIVKSF